MLKPQRVQGGIGPGGGDAMKPLTNMPPPTAQISMQTLCALPSSFPVRNVVFEVLGVASLGSPTSFHLIALSPCVSISLERSHFRLNVCGSNFSGEGRQEGSTFI
jgi:hypothetical protein